MATFAFPFDKEATHPTVQLHGLGVEVVGPRCRHIRLADTAAAKLGYLRFYGEWGFRFRWLEEVKVVVVVGRTEGRFLT